MNTADGISFGRGDPAAITSSPLDGSDTSRAAQYYGEVCAELNTATAETDGVIEAIIASVTSELLGAIAETNSMLDELIGATDNLLGQAGTPYFKLQEKLFKDTAINLQTPLTDMVNAGLTPHYTTADMQTAMDGDWLSMISAAVPPIAPYLGVSPPSPPPYSPPPTLVPYGSVGTLDASGQYLADELPSLPQLDAHSDPRLPPVAPPPPQSQEGSVVCCPAPVNVTVVVPPIAVQMPVPNPDGTYSPPAYSPPPSSYSPPGTTPAIYLSANANANANANAEAPPGVAPEAPAPEQPQPAPLLFPKMTAFPVVMGPDSVSWNSLDACARAEVVSKTLTVTPPRPPDGKPTKSMDDFIANYIPIGSGAFRWTVGKGEELWGAEGYDFLRKQFDRVQGWGKDSVNSAVDATTVKLASNLISPTSTKNPTAAIYYASRIGLANRAERATGVPLSYLYQSDIYLYQYSNPQYLPNQIRVDSAYLAGQISDDVWMCWTQANGNLPEPARRIMLADQAKPGLMELISLFRRGFLARTDLPKRVREVGVLDPSYLNEWMEITKALPTQSDLIRFMVRDASDETVAKLYGYDQGFELKFTPQMERWALALGLDPTYFKYQWRSHWEIPSFTQLTEMLARLRPDRIEVKEWEAKNEQWKADPLDKPTPGKPQVVTRDDVRQALQINDMSPGWVDRLIDVSYTPINRTDSVRAYMTGAFSDEQLLDSFQNAKYSPRDAKIMLDFYKKDKARRTRNQTGVWSARKITRYLKLALITRDEAENLLKPIMPNTAMIRDVIESVYSEMEAEKKQLQLRSLKRAFMYGEYTESEMWSILKELKFDGTQAVAITTGWVIERDGRRKQPTVSMIAKWVTMSIMTLEEGRRRLTNLGYNTLDADRILAAAMKWDYDGAPPSNEELSDAVSEVVKNQREARKKSNVGLARRIRQIIDELARIKAEQDRRKEDAGEPKGPPIVIP